jgi:zinc finger SWIM domain-containing protein 3
LPETHHLLCIFHIQENLRKNLAGKLGREYKSFYKEFLHTRNSLFVDDFHRRWARLLEKYPHSQEYLNRTLNNCCQAWAKCHQIKHFTAGIQGTQRVEVMNRLIKEGTSSHEQTQKLLDNEAQWSRHNTYLQKYSN